MQQMGHSFRVLTIDGSTPQVVPTYGY
jgi:hypothetical protein